MLDPVAPTSQERARLTARLVDVRERLARAAGRVGRDPSAIRLVAVSKHFSAGLIRAVADATELGPGQHLHFGENRVQEALQKMDQTADLPARWHLVGHLQSNKAGRVGARFDCVQTIDSAGLLTKLDDVATAAGHSLELLVQVDLAGEPTKHGARENELAPIFEAARRCRSARVTGLMLLPPAVQNPEAARPYFRELASVRQRLLGQGVAAAMLAELSMGMSHDFEVAVEEGATLVRVGTAIFGDRIAV